MVSTKLVVHLLAQISKTWTPVVGLALLQTYRSDSLLSSRPPPSIPKGSETADGGEVGEAAGE